MATLIRRTAQFFADPLGFPLDGLSVTPEAAWSMGRQLDGDYVGSFTTKVVNDIQTFHDQSGNGQDINARFSTTRPTEVTSGPNSVLAADALNDYMGDETLADYITATDFYVIAAVRPDTTSGTAYNNGGMVWKASTTSDIGMSFFDDGGTDKVGMWMDDSAGADAVHDYTITVGTDYIMEMWLDGASTDFTTRLNGGSELTTAVTQLATTVGSLRVLAAGSSSQTLDGKLYELYFFKGVPTSGERDALVNSMKSYIGIV